MTRVHRGCVRSVMAAGIAVALSRGAPAQAQALGAYALSYEFDGQARSDSGARRLRLTLHGHLLVASAGAATAGDTRRSFQLQIDSSTLVSDDTLRVVPVERGAIWSWTHFDGHSSTGRRDAIWRPVDVGALGTSVSEYLSWIVRPCEPMPTNGSEDPLPETTPFGVVWPVRATPAADMRCGRAYDTHAWPIHSGITPLSQTTAIRGRVEWVQTGAPAAPLALRADFQFVQAVGGGTTGASRLRVTLKPLTMHSLDQQRMDSLLLDAATVDARRIEPRSPRDDATIGMSLLGGVSPDSLEAELRVHADGRGDSRAETRLFQRLRGFAGADTLAPQRLLKWWTGLAPSSRGRQLVENALSRAGTPAAQRALVVILTRSDLGEEADFDVFGALMQIERPIPELEEIVRRRALSGGLGATQARQVLGAYSRAQRYVDPARSLGIDSTLWRGLTTASSPSDSASWRSALGNSGSPPLVAIASDATMSIEDRASWIWAIRFCAGPRAEDVLARALDESDPRLTASAVMALAWRVPSRIFVSGLTRLLRDEPDERQREAVVVQLGRHLLIAPEVASLLQRVESDDPSPRVRAAAARQRSQAPTREN